MQEKLTEAQSKIESLEAEKAEHGSTVAALETKIGELESAVASEQSRNEEVAESAAKKAVQMLQSINQPPIETAPPETAQSAEAKRAEILKIADPRERMRQLIALNDSINR